jgi:hypothetical protein
VPGLCELALTSSSAVVLQALIRLGFWDHVRVRTAVNTLMSLWHGRWCGCAYLGHGLRIQADDGSVDLNGLQVPCTNEGIYPLDWFTDEKKMMQIVGHRSTSPHYSWLDIGGNDSLIEKSSVGMGDCTLGVHEALSYHPDYPGSNLEVIAALEFSRRQSSTGRWGDTHVSAILNGLRRLSHPLSAFLVLRSVPSLIAEQRPDGLWSDGKESETEGAMSGPRADASREVSGLTILRALKRFGFLEATLPVG